MKTKGSLLVVAPELYAREGGVQVYSRTLLQALLVALPKSVGIQAYARNDSRGAVQSTPRLIITGFASRFGFLAELHLSIAVLWAAWRNPPFLIISTHPQFSPLLWLAGRISHAPTWCACHGIDVWQLRSGIRRWALQRLDRLLPVSRFTRDHLKRQFQDFTPELVVFPNCFDSTRFCPGPRPDQLMARYGFRSDQQVVFCLTRLTSGDRDKHVDSLIEAMPILRRHIPDIRLLIGGSGDDLGRLRDLVDHYGLSDAVVFAGAINENELADHYRLASVFALPSEKEGFGIVFLEALGCGCPVLAGNRDGSRDPLADGEFGLLVDPRRPLAPPLLALLQGSGRPLWFDRSGLSKAVGHRFGFESMCDRLNSLLPPLC